MSKPIPAALQEHFQQLLMGAVDGELTPEQQLEFNQLIEAYPHLKDEWQEYAKLKEVVKTMKLKTPPDEVWDRYWLGVYNRLERGIGWILFSVGAIILITYGIYHFIETLIVDQQLSGIVKFGIIAVIAGVVILLISVAREKLIVRQKDPYKEVKR